MAETKATKDGNGNTSQFLHNLQQSVIGFFDRADTGRSFAAIGLLSASIAGVIIGSMWMTSGDYVPLYGNSESYDTGSIVQTLESEGIDYEVKLNDGSIWVPKSKLASARMKMAANGIKAEVPAGMESLDENSGISTSQFMESNRYNYAIEGELSKTIMSLDGVTRARVHLAIPERTLFVGREEQKPTASVALNVSRNLTPAQVTAIVNLVSGSVTGLAPDAVSVVDQRGNLLSNDLHSQTPAKVSVEQMDYVSRLESQIAERAGDMLDPVLGPDNYRIRVAADVDFAQVEETQERLEGAPVLISESGMSDTSAQPTAGGIPGSLSNQVPLSEKEMEEIGITDGAQNKREEFSRRYETGRSVIHRKHGQSRIEHISVSVLINDSAAPEEGWSDEQVAKFENMVRLAAGIDEERGDQLSVSTAPFVDIQGPEAPEPTMMETISQYIELLKLPFIGLILILLVLFGIRPLAIYLTKPGKSSKASNQESESSEAQEAAQESESAKKTTDLDYELPSSESELSVQVDHLKMLVDKKTPHVTEIVKTWVRNND